MTSLAQISSRFHILCDVIGTNSHVFHCTDPAPKRPLGWALNSHTFYHVTRYRVGVLKKIVANTANRSRLYNSGCGGDRRGGCE